MPYTYVRFGDNTLPFYNTEQDHGTGEADSTFITTASGAYDFLGDTTFRRPRVQQIPVSGVYYDELDYLVEDGTFDYIADESGDLLVLGDTGDTLRNQLDSFKAKVGKSDQLWRQDLDTNDLRWKRCRLKKFDYPKSYQLRGVLAEIAMMFETTMGAWRSETATTTNDTLAATENIVQVDVLGTENVSDAVITITASTTITSVQIVLPSTSVDFTWTGSLTAGQILEIDTGKLTIKKNGADAYSGFALAGTHLARGWLTMLGESNELEVTTDGTGTISVEHYDQWT